MAKDFSWKAAVKAAEEDKKAGIFRTTSGGIVRSPGIGAGTSSPADGSKAAAASYTTAKAQGVYKTTSNGLVTTGTGRTTGGGSRNRRTGSTASGSHKAGRATTAAPAAQTTAAAAPIAAKTTAAPKTSSPQPQMPKNTPVYVHGQTVHRDDHGKVTRITNTPEKQDFWGSEAAKKQARADRELAARTKTKLDDLYKRDPKNIVKQIEEGVKRGELNPYEADRWSGYALKGMMGGSMAALQQSRGIYGVGMGLSREEYDRLERLSTETKLEMLDKGSKNSKDFVEKLKQMLNDKIIDPKELDELTGGALAPITGPYRQWAEEQSRKAMEYQKAQQAKIGHKLDEPEADSTRLKPLLDIAKEAIARQEVPPLLRDTPMASAGGRLIDTDGSDEYPESPRYGIGLPDNSTFNHLEVDSKTNYEYNNKVMEQIKSGKGEIAKNWKKATDEEGYIINQSYVSKLHYGVKNSVDNGCSWIAAYNALKHLGEESAPPDIIADMENHLVARGTLGSDPEGMAEYFEENGYHVDIVTNPNTTELNEQVGYGDVNIIYYERKNPLQGAHFIAFVPDGKNEKGETTYRFYNTLTDDSIRTLSELQKRDPAMARKVIVINK